MKEELVMSYISGLKTIVKVKNNQRRELANVSNRSRKINQRVKINRLNQFLNSANCSIYAMIALKMLISSYGNQMLEAVVLDNHFLNRSFCVK